MRRRGDVVNYVFETGCSSSFPLNAGNYEGVFPGPLRAARRRMIYRTVLAAGAAVPLGFAVWLILDPGVVGPLATIAGLFTGVIALLLSLADFLRQEPAPLHPATIADDLGLRLREQWLEEAAARQLRDPRVLPLTWRSTTRDVVDDVRSLDSPVVRTRLDGRLDGRFDDVIGRLAQGWARVPNGRLVVIGEPGSGKTVLAMLLTLGLLGARESGGRVPVLLTVSSWDPVRERLDDWIVRTLAQPYYNGRTEIPRALLTHGLLLPVLDGLDEIPESARRSAIRNINHAIGGERPVVVTCRATEYEDLIRAGAPMLRRAAVVEISPLPPEDVIGYLGEVDWPARVDWAPVFAHLRARRDGALAVALSTPLMVTSARLVYERGGGSPEELLDDDRFDSVHAVEDHVIHGLVDAAYAPDPSLPDGVAPAGWTPAQARRWLTFLASYLHDQRERDLAWWLISGRLLSAWAGPMAGLGIGILLVLASVVWMSVTGSIALADRDKALVVSLIVGGVFALLHSLVWYVSGARPPGRLTWSVRGSAERLLRGFRMGVVLALICVVPLMFGWTLIRVMDKPGGQSTPMATELYIEALAVSVALAIVVGFALAAHNWLDAPPSRATQVSPMNSLVQDRRSAIFSAVMAGLVAALLGLISWWFGEVAGELLLGLLTRGTGWPGHLDVRLLAADRWNALTGAFGNPRSVVGVAMLLPGVFLTLLVLMGRAWPRFVLARFALAVRGKLPWRLMTFLADARRRELLRQAGGVYQFRHIRLQETLAAEPTYEDEELAGEAARQATVRRRVVLAAGAGVAATGTALLLSRRRDESVAGLAVPERRKVVGVAMRPGAGREVAFALEGGSVWRWGGYTASRSFSLAKSYPKNTDEEEPTPVLAFSTDGERLMATREVAGGVSIWDLPGDGFRHVGFPSNTATIASLLAAHGDYMAWSDSSHIGVWKGLRGGVPLLFVKREFTDDIVKDGYDANLAGMAFLRDDSLVLMGDAGGMWHYPLPDFGHPENDASRLHLIPDSIFDSAYGTVLCASRYDDSLAAFGPKGAQLHLRQQTGWVSFPYILGEAVRTGAFHPKRPLLAVASKYGGDVQLWYLDETPEPRKGRNLRGHNDSVLSLDFSSDGHWLATASADGTLRIWDATTL